MKRITNMIIQATKILSFHKTIAIALLVALLTYPHNCTHATSVTPSVTETNITLSKELTVPVTQYSTTGNKTLILWIPAEFGTAPKQQATIARGLSQRGVDVWHLNLHDAYFVQRSRNSVDKFKAKDIYALMKKATQK